MEEIPPVFLPRKERLVDELRAATISIWAQIFFYLEKNILYAAALGEMESISVRVLREMKLSNASWFVHRGGWSLSIGWRILEVSWKVGR